MWNDLENKVILYADDTTLYAEVASPSGRINVANSLNRDLFKIQLWFSIWGMKLNSRKTHSITISQFRTPHPPHLPLNLRKLDLKVCSSLKFLRVILDKLTFWTADRKISNITVNEDQTPTIFENPQSNHP